MREIKRFCRYEIALLKDMLLRIYLYYLYEQGAFSFLIAHAILTQQLSD
jgi:hypothetical protein